MRLQIVQQVVEGVVVVEPVLVDQLDLVHVPRGDHGLLGHVRLELVISSVLQRVVHLLANVTVLVPSGKFSVTQEDRI